MSGRISTVLMCIGLTLTGFYGFGPPHGKADLPAENTPASPRTAPHTAFQVFENELDGVYTSLSFGGRCALTLKYDHRFTFEWRDAKGEVDYRNAGTWQLQGDVVALQPEKPDQQSLFSGLSTRFIPVKWNMKDDRAAKFYLVEENQMPGFCGEARSLSEMPFHGIMSEDLVKSPLQLGISFSETLPHPNVLIIPERYKTFYEHGDVKGHVVAINKDGSVVLDKGTADRVTPKMLFAFTGVYAIDLQVVSITAHQSVARLIYFWNSTRFVKIGDVFTTGAMGRRPHAMGYEHFNQPPIVPKPDK